MISPFIKGEAPMLFYQLYRFGFILVLVFLIPFFLIDVGFDSRTCLFKSGQRKFLIDFLSQVERVLFVILKAYFHQIAFGDEMLVCLVFMIKLGINRKDVFLKLFGGDVL